MVFQHFKYCWYRLYLEILKYFDLLMNIAQIGNNTKLKINVISKIYRYVQLFHQKCYHTLKVSMGLFIMHNEIYSNT